MPIEKEFGKLSADQIRQLLQWLPILDSMRPEMRSSIQGRPDKFEQMAPDGITWANLYERKIEEHLVELVIAVGAGQFVIEASQADDPAQVLLDSISVDDDDGLPDLSDDPLAMHRIFGLLYALLNSFESLMVYGYYINELVAMARNGGLEGDKALLNAVRIDPTVIAGPTGSVRLTRAVLFDDVRVFGRISPGRARRRRGIKPLTCGKFRFVIQLLAESHVIDLPNKALIKLVIDVGAYADTAGSEKNVSELIRKAKKRYAISK